MQNIHNWHNLTPEETLATLHTTPTGLSEEDASQRLKEFGLNKLPAPVQRSLLLRFLSHFHNILIYVLIGAAGTTALLGHVVDTSVIIAVVIINAVIGFYQEGKAEKAMEAIRHMLALRASVIRDGKRQVIPGDELVPGDIGQIITGSFTCKNICSPCPIISNCCACGLHKISRSTGVAISS